MASFASLKSQVFDREDRKQHYQAHIRGLNAFDRHHKFLNDYGALKQLDDEQSSPTRRMRARVVHTIPKLLRVLFIIGLGSLSR
ncbi:uncharacterized protein LOC141657607 isoform X3 [Silene latifolia]|uniref:uncharacterized protein LOC141657607 isoform X3 n=1 Tax=Silene latifolia TaxID=37657 RepID=UPI003D775B43